MLNIPNKIIPKLTIPNPSHLKSNIPPPKPITNRYVTGSEKPKTSNTGGFLNNPLYAGASKMLGTISDSIPTLDQSVNSTDETMQNIRSSANKALLSGTLGPIGMIAGGINTIIDKTGGFSDASKGLGGGTDFLNSASSLLLPGAGWFAKKTDKFKVDQDLASSSGFTGTAGDAQKVSQNTNAKLLFGRNKANNQIAGMKTTQNTITGLLDKNKQLKESVAGSSQDINQSNMFKKAGGWQGMQMGRKGMKLDKIWAKSKLNKKDESTMSIIPEGALHARKHNLQEVNSDLADNITNKGIPVVEIKEDGGEIIQHVEIERGEIIFTDKITEELEELWEEGTEEAMIKAGKLISNEIVNNTVDKSKEYELND